jgi:hypothetical protein
VPDRCWRAIVAERVRARSPFVGVSGGGSRIATDFVLSGTLERLEEVDEARQVAAVCSISAQLVDTRTRAVMWSRIATGRVPVDQRDVAGVVNGLTTAVRAAVDRLVTDMEIELDERQHRSTFLRGCGGVMPLLARTPSLSTKQATTLKPSVYPLGTDQPQAAIGLSERTDFHVGELDAPLAQGLKGFERSLEKIRAELLVCQNLADDQLHGSLRHDLHAVVGFLVFGARSQSLPSRRRKSNVAAAVRVAKHRARPQIASVTASFDLSEYTRVRVNVQRTVVRTSTIRAWTTTGHHGTALRLPQEIVERATEAPLDDSGAMMCGRCQARLERRTGRRRTWRSVSVRRRSPVRGCPWSTACWPLSRASVMSVTCFST